MEIKFRVWDIEDKEMHYIVSGIDQVDQEVCCQSDLLKMHEDYGYPLMLFIGLWDRMGKEIYEGDILDIWYPDVKSPHHKDIVIYRNNAACFDTKFVEDWLRAEIEIIGNIYKNPELIKNL